MITATLTNRPPTTNEEPWAKGRALVVAAGPVLLTAALLWHPPLPGRPPDSAGVAAAAAADITRWGPSHLALALACGAVAIAFAAVRSYLRERGDGPTGAVGLGLVLIGSVMLAVLAGMEFAVVAAHGTGADLAATLTALEAWFVPILVAGAVPFALGTVLFAVTSLARRLSPASPRSSSPAPWWSSDSPGWSRSGSCSSRCSRRRHCWLWCHWPW